MNQYFITGTDTEVGKTYVTCHLLKAAESAQKTSLGYKPISAGCELVDNEWVNEDASEIQQASSIKLPISTINPIAFLPPIAPHIAAKEAGVELTSNAVVEGLVRLQQETPELLLMEGAGGWRLPLTDTLFLSDVVSELKMDVILVVGMKLGCLNHALLTAQAIQHDGLNIVGWVANDITGCMSRYDDNLATLKNAMPAPLLLEVPFSSAPSADALQAAIQKLC